MACDKANMFVGDYIGLPLKYKQNLVTGILMLLVHLYFLFQLNTISDSDRSNPFS